MSEAFDDFLNHDTTPTFQMSDAVKVRVGELNKAFEQALQQGYIESSVATQLLDLVKELLPLLAAGAGA